MTNSGQRGVSLLIVLIMLVVIGLTSAASLRSASSNERISNNFRMHALAEQYAEAALRYCETQLSLADGARVDRRCLSRLGQSAHLDGDGWRLCIAHARARGAGDLCRQRIQTGAVAAMRG